MIEVIVARWRIILFTALATGLAVNQANAESYKGALLSDPLVFEVTLVSGDSVQVETWFAQWEGNVYSRALDANVPLPVGIYRTRKVCESASWIAPKRHIWKEGDPPYLTLSQDLKASRLEHTLKKARCGAASEEIQGVSRRALKNAQAWLRSRQLSSTDFDRNKNEIGSVEAWIRENVPGVVSIRMSAQKPSSSLASLAM